MKKYFFQLIILALVLFFVSACESIPEGMNSANWFALLPSDASYYLIIDSNNARDLVKDLLKKSPYYSSDTETIVNNTNRIYMSVLTKKDGRPELSFVFIGGYPQFFIKSALDGNKEWDAIPGEQMSWRNNLNGLELAVPSGYCILLSQGPVQKMLDAWDRKDIRDISIEIEKEIGESDLLVFFPVGIDEATASEMKLNIKRTLIKEIWISGKNNRDKMNLTSVIHVSDDINPEAFKKLFQFMVLAILRKQKIDGSLDRMKDVQFYVEDRKVKMTNFYLTRDEFITIVTPLMEIKEEK